MKICTKCKTKKSIKEFNKKSKSKDGYNSHCRECNKEALKSHYRRNKEKYKERNNKKREQLRKDFQKFKETLSCTKCDEDRWWVLDFHHRDPKMKDGYVGRFFIENSKDRFEKELEKCDVLCANCHRDAHYEIDNR